jgi:hypothetical protein
VARAGTAQPPTEVVVGATVVVVDDVVGVTAERCGLLLHAAKASPTTTAAHRVQ